MKIENSTAGTIFVGNSRYLTGNVSCVCRKSRKLKSPDPNCPKYDCISQIVWFIQIEIKISTEGLNFKIRDYSNVGNGPNLSSIKLLSISVFVFYASIWYLQC